MYNFLSQVERPVYDFTNGVERAVAMSLEFIPRLVAFVAILVIGYFIAKFLGGLLDKVLEKVGFDKAVERGGIKKAMARSGYDASSLLGQLVFYALMLFVLQLAFAVFGPNPISDLINSAIAFIPNIIVAALIVVIGAAIATGVKDIIRGALGGLSYGATMANVGYIGIMVIAVFAALNQLNVAPEIVNGLFYAALAIIVGVTVVAVGGGGIQPMRTRWETALGRVESEVPRMKEHVKADGQAASVRPTATPRTDQGGYVS
jgi:hypothetical protein